MFYHGVSCRTAFGGEDRIEQHFQRFCRLRRILRRNKTMKSFYYAAKCGVSGKAAGNVVPCDLRRRRRHGVKHRNKNIF